MRSRAAIDFDAIVKSGQSGDAKVWAARLGASVASVDSYRSGRRKPSKEVRKLIREAGGPDPQLWDELPPQIEVRRIPDEELEPEEIKASPEATRSLADRLTGEARRLMTEVALIDEVSRRVAATEKLAAIVKSLGSLTGAAMLNERQIRRSPAWQRIESAIADALTPYPDAMSAVVSALEALEPLE